MGVSDDGAMTAPGGIDRAYHDGVRDVRFMVRPGRVEEYDRAIHRADELGMRIVLTPLAEREGYPGYARWLVKRWPEVDAVTVWNEPEISGYKYDPCGYASLFHRTSVAIRDSNPRVAILLGGFSPHGTWPWLKKLVACRGTKLRPRHIAFHPYQWSTDPMSPKQVDTQDGHGDWLGIGRLPRVQRWLSQRRTLRALGLRRPPKFWINEFGYLNGYGATPHEVREWWPRALKVGDRLKVKAVFAQGAYTYGEDRKWNSSMPDGLIESLTGGTIYREEQPNRQE